jgi:hypothetical protein
MTYFPEMVQTQKSFRSGFEAPSNLSANKRKRLAVLAKPQRCKPDAVCVFRMAWD